MAGIWKCQALSHPEVTVPNLNYPERWLHRDGDAVLRKCPNVFAQLANAAGVGRCGWPKHRAKSRFRFDHVLWTCEPNAVFSSRESASLLPAEQSLERLHRPFRDLRVPLLTVTRELIWSDPEGFSHPPEQR